jgi:hypothetical protein
MNDEIASVRLASTEAGEPEDMQWRPTPGRELAELLVAKLPNDPDAVAKVTASSRAILGRGLPPGKLGTDTGLVVGYVQSGKTLSFTAVMALARDNGFQLVIVIAGSSTQLTDQSDKRIKKDLRINTDGPRTWTPYLNPKPSMASGIDGLLDEWRDTNVAREECQTILITVMKQHTHLRNLATLLASLNLQGVSALIIDDEADQASLNTEAQRNANFGRARTSTTYRRLMEVRRALPSHTYVQYTATPQAPLLISIIDSLSARWVDVLEPGKGYAGGITFFGPPTDRSGRPSPPRPTQEAQLVRLIPTTDIPSAQNSLTSTPRSLLQALQLFLVGVSAGLVQGGGTRGNRSMLVHPSTRTADHQAYWTWINDLLGEWRSTFQSGGNDAEELAETFRGAYDDLATTVGGDIPSFDEVKRNLHRALRKTEAVEVNRRQGGPVLIEWGQRYGWILVGGLAMDRGFTVEGLTVTYMPRGLGGGNADTMQQRARFFGYKRNYLGYCRVFLSRDAKQGFEDYVEHEEFMRRDLMAVRDSADGLKDWPRRFVLDPALKPCRDMVLTDSYTRSAGGDDAWLVAQAFMGGDEPDQENAQVVARFLARHMPQLRDDDGHPARLATQRHKVSQPLQLRDVVDELITRFRVRDPVQAEEWTKLGAFLGRLLDETRDATAVVYLMSGGATRNRGLSPAGRVKQLFQGAYPVSPPTQQGSIYPGDREIFDAARVTIQIHMLSLDNEKRERVAEAVPFLAVKLPAVTGLRPIVTQTQAAQVSNQGGST